MVAPEWIMHFLMDRQVKAKIEKIIPGEQIEEWSLPTIAKKIYPEISAKQPDIKQEEFNKKMLEHMETFLKLVIASRKNISEIFERYPDVTQNPNDRFAKLGQKTREPKMIIANYLYELDSLGLAITEQIKSLKFFNQRAQRWAAAEPREIGNYIIAHTFGLHPDTPLSIAIRTTSGLTIGTIGGFIAHQQGKTTVNITNAQGVAIDPKNKLNKAEVEKIYEERYGKLNELLKENWRVFFIKEIIKSCGKRFDITCHLPRKFIGARITNKEFQRQIWQATYTYKKAGLKPQLDGTWKFERPKMGKHRRI